MKRFLFAALLLSGCPVLRGQQSAYQDADSNTSIYLLSTAGNLTFNVSDSTFKIGVIHVPEGNIDPTEKQQWCTLKCIYGVNFTGKPSTDLKSQIFQTGTSPANIGGGGVFGFHRLGLKSVNVRDDEAKKAGHKAPHLKDHWLFADVQVTRSTFSTIATATSAPVAQTFTGVSFLPTFDIAYQFKGINLLAGASGGLKRVNNVDQLTRVSVNSVVGQTGTTTIIQSSDSYLGTYASALNVPIYSDFVIIPKHLEWLSIDAFERANVLKTDGYAEGGIGIFIAQPKAGGDFSKVLGGVSIGWKDGDRSVAIVGGWTF